MIQIRISPQDFMQHDAVAYGVPVFEGTIPGIAASIKPWFAGFTELAEQRGFSGKPKQVIVIPILVNAKPRNVIFVGAGSSGDTVNNRELYRRAVAGIVRQAQGIKATSLVVHIPDPSLLGYTPQELVHETVIALVMAMYHFNEFIDGNTKDHADISDILLTGPSCKNVAESVVHEAYMIARAVNKARYWIDMPPSMMTPPHLADMARDVARHNNLAITVFQEEEIIKMGMGGLAAVSRGSEIDCQLIIMEYKTESVDAPTIALVGKGITFDSGGLSLKPARSMESMKEDMSGAAAVIAAMEVIAHIKPSINVIAVAPTSENLPSGTATKPGDIITFYNGKTAEVRNTDAEGRLILADALSYVVKHYKPDAIIDLATLTGACSYALGPYFAGMMSEHDDFVTRVQASADRTGDRVWRLPLHDDYKAAIKSTVADICNIGNEKIMAGTITAAHFLQHFVNDTPWVHLDIAGTAFDVPNIPYFRDGATGYGVRLLIDLVRNWKK